MADVIMSRLFRIEELGMREVTCDVAVSLDSFVAGPNQSLENPFGEGVEGRLYRWMFEESDRRAGGSALASRLFAGVQNLTWQPLDVSGTELVTHITYRAQR